MAIDLKSLNHNQLSDLIARAKARQAELAKEKVAKLRDKISALVKAEGIALDEVFGALAAARRQGQPWRQGQAEIPQPGDGRHLVWPRQASALVRRCARRRQEGKGFPDRLIAGHWIS
jgi:DNA-binding protein H-NS